MKRLRVDNDRDDLEHRLKVVLNRLANGRKTTWSFYEEYAITETGEILYQSEYPALSWQAYVE